MVSTVRRRYGGKRRRQDGGRGKQGLHLVRVGVRREARLPAVEEGGLGRSPMRTGFGCGLLLAWDTCSGSTCGDHGARPRGGGDLFEALGLEVSGRQFVEGEFIDTVCGIPGSKTEVVGLSLPGAEGGTWLEVARFITPDHLPGLEDPPANRLGIRNVCYQVDDIEATVQAAAGLGYGLVGGIGEYEGIWKQAYIRGPEGFVVAVAEPIG